MIFLVKLGFTYFRFWAQNKGSFGQIFGTPVTRVFGTPKIQFCRFYWDENTAFYYFLASDRRASACRERKYLMYITILYYFLLFFTIFKIIFYYLLKSFLRKSLEKNQKVGQKVKKFVKK